MKKHILLISALALVVSPLLAKDKEKDRESREDKQEEVETNFFNIVVSCRKGEIDEAKVRTTVAVALKEGRVISVVTEGNETTVTVESAGRVSKTDITRAFKDMKDYKVEEVTKLKEPPARPDEDGGKKESDEDMKDGDGKGDREDGDKEGGGKGDKEGGGKGDHEDDRKEKG